MTSVTTVPASIVLISGDRFFLKELTLDPATPAAAQVELALEESSPFPLTQMYHGFVTSADGHRALAYATYRRRFTPEETAEWADAEAIVPDFLALLGPPSRGPLILIQAQAGGLNGVAWDGQAGWPRALLAQASVVEPTEAQIAEMAAELQRRSGLGGAEVRRLSGPVGAAATADGGLVFHVDGEETFRLAAAAVAAADVRDKVLLGSRRREAGRRKGWWLALVAVGLLGLLAAGLEIAAAATGAWNRRRQEAVVRQAGEVARIETAETVAKRIEDLAARPDRPFEWLAMAAAARPRSVQFLRAMNRRDRTLEIEVQSPDAADAGAYEAALRRLAAVEQVETRELRAREGLTTFVMAVKFKPVALPAAGGVQ